MLNAPWHYFFISSWIVWRKLCFWEIIFTSFILGLANERLKCSSRHIVVTEPSFSRNVETCFKMRMVFLKLFVTLPGLPGHLPNAPVLGRRAKTQEPSQEDIAGTEWQRRNGTQKYELMISLQRTVLLARCLLISVWIRIILLIVGTAVWKNRL